MRGSKGLGLQHLRELFQPSGSIAAAESASAGGRLMPAPKPQPAAAGQPAAKSPYANEIRVSIVPQRQLPEPADVVVGRVSIFRQRGA